MPTRELFSPDGFYSLRSIRAELLKLKNSQDKIIFNNEDDLDNILTQFWFKDRETAFIALEHIYPHFKQYLEKTPLANISRTSTYAYIFKDIKKHKELTEFSIECERQCKNEFSGQELDNLTSGTKLTTDWLLENKIIKKHADEKGEFYATFHHTITEFLVSQYIIESKDLTLFKDWSTLKTPTKRSQTYFNQSWYGVAQFLLESDLFDQTLDFFLQIGEKNNEVVDQNFSENISRVNFPDPHDPRKDQLFKLIYNATKNSNRWISPWAEDGLANLYHSDLYPFLKADLLDKPTKLEEVIQTSNSVTILGNIISKNKITDAKQLKFLKSRFVNYANQTPDSGVLQRESYNALAGFNDPKVIDQILTTYNSLSDNLRNQLVKESFLRLCYTVAPNEKQSVDTFLDALSGNSSVYAWQGLKHITDPDSLLYLLSKISQSVNTLNQIQHDESIFFKTDQDEINPLRGNLATLSQTHSLDFQKLVQEIIYLACSSVEFYPFNDSLFLRFLYQQAINVNSDFPIVVLKNKPKNWSIENIDNTLDFLIIGLNQKNYLSFCKLVKRIDPNHRPRLYLIEAEETKINVAKFFNIELQSSVTEPAYIKGNSNIDELHKRLYLDQNNPEIYRTDLYQYYLDHKDDLKDIAKSDLQKLWYFCYTKGLKLIDPANFQIKINKHTDGRNFNWSTHASFFGDMIRVVKELKPETDLKKYKNKLLNFIPFCFSDDFSFVEEQLPNKLTQKDINLLNKLYSPESGDRRYLLPDNYVRIVKERGIGKKGIKETLISFLNDDLIDSYAKSSAIETLPLFTNIKDRQIYQILKQIEQGSTDLKNQANESLIKIYHDQDSINLRFSLIKDLKKPKRIRQSGQAYSLDSDESEYSNLYLPKALIEIKDHNLAPYFFELLKDSLNIANQPQFQGFVEYVNRITASYLESLASKNNFDLINQLEDIVGKNSLYWNYQLPLLKSSFLTRKEENGNNTNRFSKS